MEPVTSLYRPGNVSYEKNKIAILTEKDSTSILFEDISSLSFRKQSFYRGNKTIMILGIFVFFISLISCLSNAEKSSSVSLLGLLSLGGIIMVIVGIFSDKIDFENVIIETRGGSKVYFSVNIQSGEDVISSIENKRREFHGSVTSKENQKKNEPEIDKNIDASNDIFEQLEKLSKLKDAGILTNEEFDEQKSKLLSKL